MTGLLGAVVGVVSLLFKMLVANLNTQINELQIDRNYYRDIALRSVNTSERMADVAQTAASIASRTRAKR